MSAVENRHSVDHLFAAPINFTGDVMNFGAQIFLRPIDWLKNLPVEKKKEHIEDTPFFIDTAKAVILAFTKFHAGIFHESAHYSTQAKERTERLVQWLTSPISCCQTGLAIQILIGRRILGNIALAVTFCAYQVLHLIPYFLMTTVVSITHVLYQATPVALITGLAASILSIQIYFIIRLVKEIQITNKILESKADEMIEAINLVQIAKNTLWDGYDLTKRVLKGSVSWIPTGRFLRQ